jgi:hypothetical protein
VVADVLGGEKHAEGEAIPPALNITDADITEAVARLDRAAQRVKADVAA